MSEMRTLFAGACSQVPIMIASETIKKGLMAFVRQTGMLAFREPRGDRGSEGQTRR